LSARFPDRRSKRERRSLFERRSPINRRSSSDRVSASLRRSLLDRRSLFDRLSSSAMRLLHHIRRIWVVAEQAVNNPNLDRQPDAAQSPLTALSVTSRHCSKSIAFEAKRTLS
jgi:hypothetical protein